MQTRTLAPHFTLDVTKPAAARSGQLVIGSSYVNTPCLWLGQQLGGVPQPWTYPGFPVPGVMLNAFDFLLGRVSLKKIRARGLKTYLDYDGPIFMDSGGFLLQAKEQFGIGPKEILALYSDLSPDLAAVLDYPLRPASTASANGKRWLSTLRNTVEMLSGASQVPLVPVVHGYTLKDLETSCKQIETHMGTPRAIALGSLVPLIKGMFVKGRFWKQLPKSARTNSDDLGNFANLFFVVEAVRLVRNYFPKSFFHVFGVGSTTTMHALFYLGVDSVDTTGWRLKAAHGAIQLPGHGDLFVKCRRSASKTRKRINHKQLDLLNQCRCPVCRANEPDTRQKALGNSFQARATHNAWVFIQEAARFRSAQRDGRITVFTKRRLRGSLRYSAMLEYALRSATNDSK
jgi:queuine/archaeosine tRNA-ribosyltransferase